MIGRLDYLDRLAAMYPPYEDLRMVLNQERADAARCTIEEADQHFDRIREEATENDDS